VNVHRRCETRRGFLARSAALGAGLAFGLPGGADPDASEPMSDGSDVRGMVTPEAQQAIDRGLAYLGGTQNRDGSFGERQQYSGNIAVTSLAGLAFMAGGHHAARGVYGTCVLRALEFVLGKEQRLPAGFLHNQTGPRQGPMYSHGFGTLFLAEAYGMARDPALQQRLRGTIERAVQLIVSCQNSEGGWRYDPQKQPADVSVTICQIMALRAARNAGFFVPKETVDRCVRYVRSCQSPTDGGFTYFANQGNSAFARSAAGVVALYCAGIYQGDEIRRGLKYLMQYKPGTIYSRQAVPPLHYYYGQYYAVQAMWTAGGDYWRDWFPAIREELIQLQRPRADGVWTDQMTCNHYATAMACIILQIPNNYLPILQK
jgi:Prenyltransferase and squalene oxidase repeat